MDKTSTGLVKQRHIFYLLNFILLTVFVSADHVDAVQVNASEAVKKDHFVDAKPLKRGPPDYPGAEQRVANEGIVELQFMVDAEGNTFEPMVQRSTRKSFEQYAIKAVSKYKYSPATLNGKPIESRQSIRIAFEMYGSGDTVSPAFGRNYKKFNKQIAADPTDKKRLAKLIDRMESSAGMTPYAYAYLNLAKLQYTKKFGDTADQIENMEQLLLFEGRTGNKGKFIDEELRVGIRRNLVNLNIQSQQFGAALTAFSSLKEIDPAATKIFGDAYNKIIEICNNDDFVAVDIKIPERDYTSLFLFKRNFSLLEINGRIDRLKLRCRNKFKELEFSPEAEYRVPESWGLCNLQIIGTSNTSAKLAQY